MTRHTQVNHAMPAITDMLVLLSEDDLDHYVGDSGIILILGSCSHLVTCVHIQYIIHISHIAGFTHRKTFTIIIFAVFCFCGSNDALP